MGVPPIEPRMEEWKDVSRNRINCGQIRSLERIASFACQGKIRRFIRTTVLFRNNVFDLKPKGNAVLRNSAILAAP